MQFQTKNLFGMPRKVSRKISKVPFKVLDAPQLQDDFYLNLVDWSSTNSLAVGLSNSVYLWSACTSRVTKLCDLLHDAVTSVSWTQRGTHIAVGTDSGEIQIWDAVKSQKSMCQGWTLFTCWCNGLEWLRAINRQQGPEHFTQGYAMSR